MLQTAYTGLPEFLAVAIKPLVSYLIAYELPHEYVLQQLHKIKMLVAFMKQISRNTKNISIFIVRRMVESYPFKITFRFTVS